jgi:hypothetical protein
VKARDGRENDQGRMKMPLIEAALPVAAQGFADVHIDVEARTDGRLGSIQLTSRRVSLFCLCQDIPRISGDKFCDLVALAV